MSSNSPTQGGDPRDGTSGPLSVRRIRELHAAAESRSERDWLCTSAHWLLLHGRQSAWFVVLHKTYERQRWARLLFRCCASSSRENPLNVSCQITILLSTKWAVRMDFYSRTAVPKQIPAKEEMTDVNFADAIKNIELRGPSDYEVSQNSSLAFHVDGRWVTACTMFLSEFV